MLPLADLRVVAIEQFGAGPFATMQLADLGADVIKVEDPSVGGDVGRYVPPYASEGSSLFFETFNRGKRSVTLDIRTVAGRARFEELIRDADALFSNLRGDLPGKLRLRYEDLSDVNPRLVCVSLSGFGTTGPRASEGAYDLTIQALAGWMSITGGPTEPPTKSGLSLVDFSGGYVAAMGLLGGVWRARRDGVGCDVDVSLHETALSLLTYMATWTASRGWEPSRLPGSSHQTVIPFQMFAAKDGHLVVACAKESLWKRFCQVIERADLADDLRFADLEARHANRDALLPELEKALAARNVADWTEAFTASGVPSAAINDIVGALDDRQVAARNSIAGYQHPVLGEVRTVASPYGAALTRPPTRAPLLGETHREETT